MACMGPNCDYAEQKGREAYKLVAKMLLEQFNVPSPHEGEWTPEERRFYRCTLDSHAKLEAALVDLLVSEACDTW